MYTTRSLLLLTALVVPIVAFACGQIVPESAMALFVGITFSVLTGMLIACSTTHTPTYFIRKLIASLSVAATFYLMVVAVFWTWAEEQRFYDSGEWAPIGVEGITGPMRGLCAAIGVLAILGLLWLPPGGHVLIVAHTCRRVATGRFTSPRAWDWHPRLLPAVALRLPSPQRVELSSPQRAELDSSKSW